MAKNNCATAPKSFHLFNSRGQFSSEMEISSGRNSDQCTMPRSDPSNQQWPGTQGHITIEMTKAPTSRASEWKKDVFRGVHLIVKGDTRNNYSELRISFRMTFGLLPAKVEWVSSCQATWLLASWLSQVVRPSL